MSRVLRLAMVATVATFSSSLLAPSAARAQVGLGVCAANSDVVYSTEEDFVTQGPEPPDGNPIISDGDLLGLIPSCVICARNDDLMSGFGVAVDLGLDAVDLVGSGGNLLAVFSTELDSPNAGQFTAGDLLTNMGSVVPNLALTDGFGIGYDVGLDAVHNIGDTRDLIAFWNFAAAVSREEWLANPGMLASELARYEVDVWFSTEGTAPIPSAPAFLDGDVLSARNGIVVQSNWQLLPTSVPAGIPTRGVDFGLDALRADRLGTSETIDFSTEIGHLPAPVFGASDILGFELARRVAGSLLVHCFEPKSSELGIDAIALPEPAGAATIAAGTALLGWLDRRRRRRELSRPLRRPLQLTSNFPPDSPPSW